MMKISSVSSLVLLCLIFVVGGFAQKGAKSYSDKRHGFTVAYPADYKLLSNPKPDSEFLGIRTGNLMVEMEPIKLANKFNGSIALLVWSSSDSTIKCGEPSADESIEADGIDKSRTVAGETFYGYSNSSDGMGGSIRVNGYRGMVNGKCWQFQMIYGQSKLTPKGDDVLPTPFNNDILNKTLYDLLGSFKLSGK